MIGRANRFHGYNALRRVYRQGQTARTGLISLKFSLNERRKEYRAAVVVSRKVSKSAVVRNRIRRRIYEAVRELMTGNTQASDLIFTVYDEKVLEMGSSKLKSTVKSLLDQAMIK